MHNRDRPNDGWYLKLVTNTHYPSALQKAGINDVFLYRVCLSSQSCPWRGRRWTTRVWKPYACSNPCGASAWPTAKTSQMPLFRCWMICPWSGWTLLSAPRSQAMACGHWASRVFFLLSHTGAHFKISRNGPVTISSWFCLARQILLLKAKISNRVGIWTNYFLSFHPLTSFCAFLCRLDGLANSSGIRPDNLMQCLFDDIQKAEESKWAGSGALWVQLSKLSEGFFHQTC